MKVACRTNTGAGSDGGSSGLPGRVLRGATMLSSSMLKGKLACLRASIVGIDGSCLRSLTTRRGLSLHGLILNIPESPSPKSSFTTWPASHGKLASNRSRPLVKVLVIAECEEAPDTEKQKHI